jgi:acyl carrier protein
MMTAVHGGTMPDDSVFEQVRSEVVRVVGSDPVTVVPTARFVEDLGADSLDLIEIVMPVEENLGIDVSQARLNHVVTVGDLVELIRSRC